MGTNVFEQNIFEKRVADEIEEEKIKKHMEGEQTHKPIEKVSPKPAMPSISSTIKQMKMVEFKEDELARISKIMKSTGAGGQKYNLDDDSD
jgi:hypothetical protein